MKRLALLSFFLLNTTFAQSLKLDDFKYTIPDISSQSKTKEELFSGLNRSLVRLGNSACTNRAQMWVYDLKRKNEIESPKIFLFFTPKTGRHSYGSWWFHVAPMVNDKGQYWVIDGGFPSMIKTPLSIKDWLAKFNGVQSVCKEIKAGDEDLIERMFNRYTFPENTRHGRYDCYYILTPPGYWSPTSVAKHLLGKDQNGVPVNYVRDRIEEDEVYQACLEAATTQLGWAWGSGVKKCQAYMRTGLIKM